MSKIPEQISAFLEPVRNFRVSTHGVIIMTGLTTSAIGATDLIIDGNYSNTLFNALHPTPITRQVNKWDQWESNLLKCSIPEMSSEPRCLELRRRLRQYQQQESDSKRIYNEYKGYLSGPASAALYVLGLVYAAQSATAQYLQTRYPSLFY